MTFRLLGIPVQVQLGFAFMAFLVAWSDQASTAEVLLRVLVVFASVLVHELGHAFAIRRHRITPAIQLHWMGGSTLWRPGKPLGRLDQIGISLAGPFAGFLLAGLAYALVKGTPGALAAIPPPFDSAIDFLLAVNVFWGIFNLIPVLPLDGGHVLEHALGPKRARLAAGISLVVAAGLGLFMLKSGLVWGGMLMGMSALTSYRRLSPAGEPETEAGGTTPVRIAVSPRVLVDLQRARHAIENEEPDAALALAEQLLRGVGESGEIVAPPRPVAHAALEVMVRARLARGELELAAEALRSAEQLGPVDLAIVGALAFARGDHDGAARALEEARARGDRRKEVLGLLIRLRLETGAFSGASALALEIVESLSDDDVRTLGGVAYEGGDADGAARLYEALFARRGDPEAAYDAARAHARSGNRARALALLERAVRAGFADASRAWSDRALDVLHSRDDLQRVLPRPESV